MAPVPFRGDLQVGEDVDFLRRAWRVQRVGWAVLVVVLLAALLGLTGTGPLSQAAAGAEGGPLRAEYERFVRANSVTDLRVHLGPGVPREGRARLWFDRQYLHKVEVTGVVPDPESVEVGSDRVTYVFLAAEAGGPVEVAFDLKPMRFGSWRGRIGAGDAEPVPLRHFVYP
jgi:hypothetical protein